MDIIYRASDGIEFNDEDECKLYEKNLEKLNSYLVLGSSKYKLNEYYDAISYFQKVIEIDNTIEKVYFIIGRCYTELGKYQDAISYFQKAIELDIQYIKAYQFIGDCYTALGKYDDGIRYYQKAITLSEKDPILYENIGVCKYQLKEYDDAIKYFKREIELDSQSIYAYQSIGNCCFQLEQYQDAISFYKKAIEYDEKNKDIIDKSKQKTDKIWSKISPPYKRNSKVYIGIGNSKYQLKEYDDAIKYFKRAIELENEHTDVYKKIGYCYYNLEKYKKAIKYFLHRKSDLILDEVRKIEHYSDAKSYNNFKEVIEFCQKKIELDNTNEKAYFTIGNCNYQLNEYTKAIYYYRKVIELDNMNPKGYICLGNCNYRLKEYEKAIEFYKQAFELDKNSFSILWSIIKTKNDLGLAEEKDTIQYLKQAIGLVERLNNLFIDKDI